MTEVDHLTWYHTIELPDGTVTKGWFDLRSSAKWAPLPERLDGKRCLDVGTNDGFWAFEMERRGGIVTALDLADSNDRDWPVAVDRPSASAHGERAHAAYSIAHEALGSKVERVEGSVYETQPERLGTFDIVFVGSILLHLRDPIQALASLRRVAAGELIVVEPISLKQEFLGFGLPQAMLREEDEPLWWLPNRAGLRRYVTSAGFEILETGPIRLQKLGQWHKKPPKRGIASRRTWPYRFVARPFGVPTSWVRAVPRPDPQP